MADNSNEYSERLLGLLQNEIIERNHRIYSEKVLKECENPKNSGKIEDYDSHGVINGSCGDTVEIYLKVDNDNITDISFVTDGCKATIACCSVLTEMVKGIDIEDAKAISSNDLIDVLNGLPDDKQHCAVLVVATLRKSIRGCNGDTNGVK